MAAPASFQRRITSSRTRNHRTKTAARPERHRRKLLLNRGDRGENTRRQRQLHARWNRFAEKRLARFRPGKALGVHVAIVPAALLARLGMKQNPVLQPIMRLNEGTMAHAPDFRISLEYRRVPFFPVRGIANIAALKFEQAQAVVRRPTAARRIHDE